MLDTLSAELNSIKVTEEGCWLGDQELKRIDLDCESPTGESGSVKHVYATDHFVIKSRKEFRTGRCQVMGEVRFECEPEDQKHFAKVIYASIDRNWYVQERVSCVPCAPATKEQAVFVRALGDKYDINDISSSYDEGRGPFSNDPWCYHHPTHNWTIDLNGTPIIFDYDGY